MKKNLGVIGWILSFIVLVALINWGLLYWFNLNLLSLISFGIKWIEITLASLVAVIGTIGLINLIIKTFL